MFFLERRRLTKVEYEALKDQIPATVFVIIDNGDGTFSYAAGGSEFTTGGDDPTLDQTFITLDNEVSLPNSVSLEETGTDNAYNVLINHLISGSPSLLATAVTANTLATGNNTGELEFTSNFVTNDTAITIDTGTANLNLNGDIIDIDATTVDITANVTETGTLNVSDDVTFQSDLDVLGNTDITGTLDAGASTLDSLSVTNAASVGTTLSSGGLATLNSLAVINNETIGGSLGVMGATTVAALTASGAVINNGTVTNNSTTAMNGSVTAATGGADFTIVNGAGDFVWGGDQFKITPTNSSGVIITGNASVSGTLSAGAVSFSSLSLSGALSVAGLATFTGGMTKIGNNAVNLSSGTADITLSCDEFFLNASAAGTPINLGANTGINGSLSALTSISATTTLSSGGMASLNSLAVTNGATVGSTLGVSGATTVAALTASGAVIHNGTVTNNSTTAMNGAVTATTGGADFTIVNGAGDFVWGGDQFRVVATNVTTPISFTGDTSVTGNFSTTGRINCGGNMAITGTTTHTGAVTNNSTTTANGGFTSNGLASFTSGITTSGNNTLTLAAGTQNVVLSGNQVNISGTGASPINLQSNVGVTGSLSTTTSISAGTTISSGGLASFNSLSVTNTASIGALATFTGGITSTGNNAVTFGCGTQDFSLTADEVFITGTHVGVPISLTGNTGITGNIGVSGSTSLMGGLTTSGNNSVTLAAGTADITLSCDEFFLTATHAGVPISLTGNTGITGNLGVSGTFNASGASTVAALTASGAVIHNSTTALNGQVTAITGNTNFSIVCGATGDFTVSAETATITASNSPIGISLNGGTEVTGNLSCSNNVTVNQKVTVGNELVVTAGGMTLSSGSVGITTSNNSCSINTGTNDITLTCDELNVVASHAGIACNINGSCGITGSLETSTFLKAASYVQGQQMFLISPGSGTGTALILDGSTKEIKTLTSSERFKENIEALTIDSSKVYDLNLKSFRYIESQEEAFGYIAEEVNEIMPEAINLDENGLPFSIGFERITMFLVEEIKNLNSRISALEALQV